VCSGAINEVGAFQFTEFIDIITRCLGAVCPFFISATIVEVNFKDGLCKI
jgi:hypothetical protein